jgi:hypothetical protein
LQKYKVNLSRGPLLYGEKKKEHHVKSAVEGGSCPWFLPYRERRRKIMERETKREKREIFTWEVVQGERQQGLGIL